MKTLNLVDESKSDIKYKISKFPDGQQNIVINSKLNDLLIVEQQPIFSPPLYRYYPIQIKSRLNNWLDLELITCAVASLRELGVEDIHLYTPYIMGARSDRKFEEGGNNYIKDVLAPAINSLNFKTVTCIDPHSDVLEACIKGFRKESNLELVEFTLKKLYHVGWAPTYHKDDFILVSPDAGASKKIYKLAEQIGYNGDIITCSKDRDENGKLNKIVVPELDKYYNKDIVIIDDICDGGATFINIAKEIIKPKAYRHTGKIYLIVTHGIFSKGFDELSQYFDGIYCTNSYMQLEDKYSMDGTIWVSQNVKQLNVF